MFFSLSLTSYSCNSRSRSSRESNIHFTIGISPSNRVDHVELRDDDSSTSCSDRRARPSPWLNHRLRWSRQRKESNIVHLARCSTRSWSRSLRLFFLNKLCKRATTLFGRCWLHTSDGRQSAMRKRCDFFSFLHCWRFFKLKLLSIVSSDYRSMKKSSFCTFAAADFADFCRCCCLWTTFCHCDPVRWRCF